MRITRRRTICVILVVCLAAYARPVAAQTAPAQSLEELRTRLKAGDRLIVRDDSGDTARGTLSSLTDDEIEVEWRRWFRVRQQSFAETSIRRIEVQDSTWNGTLIGLAIGVAGIFVIDSTCRDPLCLLPMLLAPGIGAGVGGAQISCSST